MTETLRLQPESEKSDWKPVENGEIYEAEVIKVQRVTKPYEDDEGNKVEKFEFSFRITEEGEYKGHRIKGETPLFFNNSDRCKLRNWIQEILSQELPTGYELNFEELKGKPVRVNAEVKVTDRKKPGPNGETTWTNERVVDVHRPKGQKFRTLQDTEEPFSNAGDRAE